MSTSTQPAAVNSPAAPVLHINFLDGLRGLAALDVVLFHFLAFNLSGLPPWVLRLTKIMETGHSAVTVFIALSGFSLMLPVVRSTEGRLRGGLVGFIRRRARRILPPYYAALLLSLLGLALTPQGLAYLHGVRDPAFLADFTVPVVLSHLLLLHNMSGVWVFRINMALWSVATEWQIYFALPFVLIPAWRRGGAVALGAAGLVLGVIPIGLLSVGWSIFPAFADYVGIFGLGAAGAAWACQEGEDERNRPALRRNVLTATGVLVFAYILVGRYISPPHATATGSALHILCIATLKDFLVGALIVCVLVFGTLSRHAPSSLRFAPFRMLEIPVFRALGAFSYSLYLTHCIVLNQLDAYTNASHASPLTAFLFRACLGVPVALVVAYLFHLAFEKPFMVSSGSRNTRLLAEAPTQS